MIKCTASMLLIASTALVGCGTMSNLQKGGGPYGGVLEATHVGRDSFNSAGQGSCIPPILDYANAGYQWCIDAPLSLVGDTLTLPLAIWNIRPGTSQFEPNP